MQAAFHLATTLGLYLFYWPRRRSDYPKTTLGGYVWACDPVGSVLFISSATLMLLALDRAGGAYAWHDAHGAAPLSIGLVLLLVYEWKERDDGHVAHVFFQGSPNFVLLVFAFGVEGWVRKLVASNRYPSNPDAASQLTSPPRYLNILNPILRNNYKI